MFLVMNEDIQIKGIVEEIRFRNEENGYTIALVDADCHPYVVVGVFPPVSEGSFVTCEGKLVDNPRFGLQIKADSVKITMPESEYSLFRFLSSGLIKGIGPKKAESIIKMFGVKSLEIIEKEPLKLTLISGFSKKTAKSVAESYAYVKNAADAITFLMQGMTPNMAIKVYNIYGQDTIATASSNPYKLIEDIDGIGFLSADKLARAIGIDKNSMFRIKAGVLHAMLENAERTGNTVIFKAEICEQAVKLLECEEDSVNSAIDSLIIERKLREVDCDGEPGLMHYEHYIAESRAAMRLIKIASETNTIKMNCDSLIAEFESINGVSFHKDQKNAIESAINSGVSVITGGPGTGKTTIIKCIRHILGYYNKRIRLLAPTGRAAKRLSEATGDIAFTIHRLLLSDEIIFEGRIRAEVVIIDEFSMVDVSLLQRLLSILPDDIKLVIVGDSNQLPSVGPGNCLADIINSGIIPVSKLTHIYRQEGGSMIVRAAHEINSGKCPDLTKKNSDFFFIKTSSQEETASLIESLVTKRLPSYLNLSADKIQVLCPVKTGLAGTTALNNRLRRALIGSPSEKVEVLDSEFSRGDKVMHTVNNYDIKWLRYGIEGKGIFNGDMGVVSAVYPGSGEVEITFEDGRVAHYSGEDRKQLVLAYAITVHKSQGSEYDAVVIPIISANYLIMTRNLLYTAVTRAKRLVVIVGSEECVRRMISNNYIKKRYSMLKNFIIDLNEKLGNLFAGSGESN